MKKDNHLAIMQLKRYDLPDYLIRKIHKKFMDMDNKIAFLERYIGSLKDDKHKI